jgi:hypothetical protein
MLRGCEYWIQTPEINVLLHSYHDVIEAGSLEASPLRILCWPIEYYGGEVAGEYKLCELQPLHQHEIKDLSSPHEAASASRVGLERTASATRGHDTRSKC